MFDTAEVEFRDFTKKRKRIVFGVDPDRFECVPALAPDALQQVIGRFRSAEFRALTNNAKSSEMDTDVALKAVRDIFAVFLIDDDAIERFNARLGDRRNPIDIFQLVEIIGWVIEKYTGRPTQPSSISSEQSPNDDGGTSSEVGASQLVSTPSLSMPENS